MKSRIVIPEEKISYSSYSIADSYGRVFFYDDRVFRAVSKHYEEECKQFLASDLYKFLVNKKFIPATDVTNYVVSNYNLVIEHEKLPISEPHQWSFSMFRDAALLLLELNEICNSYGYEIKDGHPYNILFNENRPVFVDIGSIVKCENRKVWTAYQQFLDSFYIQLLIWQKGDYFLLRKLIEDGNKAIHRFIPMTNILNSSMLNSVYSELYKTEIYFFRRLIFSTLYNSTLRYNFILILERYLKYLTFNCWGGFNKLNSLHNLAYVKKKIEGLNKPSINSYWGKYHNAYNEAVPQRFIEIVELVKLYASDIHSATDLAGNQGIFCEFLLSKIDLKKVYLIDYDENAVDIAFNNFKQKNLKIFPYLSNFLVPIRDREIGYFKSDIVFALAVTHHLILSQNYNIDFIFSIIKKASKKYVAIEFMPLGLWDGKKAPPIPDWYTRDWFANVFCKYFDLLVERELEPNRILFLGKIFDSEISF